MKELIKRSFSVLIALLVILSLGSVSAFAEGENEEGKPAEENTAEEIRGSIRINYPVDGATAYLWRIGDYSETGTITLSSEYAAYGEKMTGDIANDAVTLSNLLVGSVAPDSEKVSQDGYAGFSNLVRGAYLVYTFPMTTDDGTYYQFIPSVFYLPYAEETEDGTAESWNVQMVVKYTMNSLPDELTVKKVWKGNSVKRSPEISVDLFCNGVYKETVLLNAKNKWTYSWPITQDACAWTVKETAVPEGYTVAVTELVDGFVITNTCPNKPHLPQTGQLWWPVPLLLIAGGSMITVGVLLSRRKKAE